MITSSATFFMEEIYRKNILLFAFYACKNSEIQLLENDSSLGYSVLSIEYSVAFKCTAWGRYYRLFNRWNAKRIFYLKAEWIEEPSRKKKSENCRVYRSIRLKISSLFIGFSYFIMFFIIEKIGKSLDGFSSGNWYYSQSNLLGSIQFIHWKLKPWKNIQLLAF